jgi:putative hydrolase of the HAD superfamily
MLDALAVDHRLGIITNGAPDLQWRKLEVTGLAHYFRPESVIISECVGLAKPHPSVFQAACDTLHVSPADALMIGDNYVADVQGALAFGMDALWYAPDPEVLLPDWLQSAQEPPISSPSVLVETIARREQARGG